MSAHRRWLESAVMGVVLAAAVPVAAQERGIRLPAASLRLALFSAELRDRTIDGRVTGTDARTWTCRKGRCQAEGTGSATAACRGLAAASGPVAAFGGLEAKALAACNATARASAPAPLSLRGTPALQPRLALRQQHFQRLQQRIALQGRATDTPSAPAARDPGRRGWVKYAQGEDCDDTRREVHPGAGEVCDYLDNNCDGRIDEGQRLTFFLDADGDGHGDAGRRIDACPTEQAQAAADGRWLVLVGNDCDDADASRWQRCE